MNTLSPNGQPPPLAPEGLADAPTSLPAHSPFFALGWHSMDRAERDALAGVLARAEEGFLIAVHAFDEARHFWLEGMAILGLAAVYRLEGLPLPDWMADRTVALQLVPEEVQCLLDFLRLAEVSPSDSPQIGGLLATIRAHRTGGKCSGPSLRRSDAKEFYSALVRLGPTGRLAIGRRAVMEGDFDIAELAFTRAANEYRQKRQPVPEAFALVELAAMYRQHNRLDRLAPLVRRTQEVEKRSSLLPEQAAIVQLAVELIESSREDPFGLDIFCACWLPTEDDETEIES